jgi:hypothetical protein
VLRFVARRSSGVKGLTPPGSGAFDLAAGGTVIKFTYAGPSLTSSVARATIEAISRTVPKRLRMIPGDALETATFHPDASPEMLDVPSVSFPRTKTLPMNAITIPVMNASCRLQTRDMRSVAAW